jgi:hypothetical protein
VDPQRATAREPRHRAGHPRHSDALEQIAEQGSYPRIPQITDRYASDALKVNLIDQEEYEEIMGTRDRLDAWLA